jgi:hypothetical protein
MTMRRLSLNRRALLKGAAGISLALPTLEAMLDVNGEALAQGTAIPTRYGVCVAGTTHAGDNDPAPPLFAPDTVGRNYDLKTGTQPLGMFGDVRQHVSVISGLQIPMGVAGQTPPAGGWEYDFHIQAKSPLLTGKPHPGVGSHGVGGASSDQIVSDAIAGPTVHKALVYRVQAGWYLTVASPSGRDLISYREDASGVRAIPATVSPRAAFDALFSGFTGPDPTASAQLDFQLRQRKSILDLVKRRTERLMPKLGLADQARLQRHLDEIRDLERRVNAFMPPATTTCQKPADPVDPAVGVPGDDGAFTSSVGYSDEETRATLLTDMIALAFACDLSRVAALQYTMFQSHMNMYALTGYLNDLHGVGHNLGNGPAAECMAWHVKHFARLVSKLRDLPEGAGTVLDNTALVFLPEGGHGRDPDTGRLNRSHSTENMVALIAGHAGGLKPGKHVVAGGAHVGNVICSAMKAAGGPDRLGDVSGVLPELFTV